MIRQLMAGLCLLFGVLGLAAQEGTIPVEQKQKSLITKRTATWCPICGDAEVWPMVKNLNASLGDKALVIAAHHSSGSTLHSQVAEDLINNHEATFGQPVFFFNRERIGNGTGTTTNILNDRTETAFQQTPLAQTGLQLTYDETNRLLEVNGRTTFYESANGNYHLAYYLIRKSVIASQSNQSSEAEHVNVLWESITEGSFGVPIDPAAMTSGGNFHHRAPYNLSEELEVDNLSIAAIIWERNEDGVYEFVNVEYSGEIQTDLVSRTFSPSQLETFTIQPTLTQGSSLARIKLSSGLSKSTLSIYNVQGQKIKTVFSGDLSEGAHFFELSVPAPGTYLITFQAGKQVSTQRLVKLR